MSGQALADAFERVTHLSLGIEEEVLLVDAETLALAPCAAAIASDLQPRGDVVFKTELPASQIEIVLPAVGSVPAAVSALREARGRLAGATAERGVLAIGTGTHPLWAGTGEELSSGESHRRIAKRYGDVAARQLVSALQVHVGVRGAERALSVYNRLRSYLPLVSALAANAPYRAGADSSLASVRPTVATMLPRQGVPPALESWHAYSEALAWGARTGFFPEPGDWWWELRPHPAFGTIEVRVPDTQATVAESAGVIAFVHCLVASMADAYDRGEQEPPAPPDWKIAENRWSACRDGVRGRLADPQTGETVATAEAIRTLCESFDALAGSLGCESELEEAARMAAANGAIRQREVTRRRGPEGLVRWLGESYAGR